MSKTILHIDDEEDIRDVVAAYLTAKGFRVLSAASRSEALKIAGKDKPDLMICDLQLDESDGIEAIQQLKALVPDMPVILFTGVLFESDIAPVVNPKTVSAYVPKTGPLQGLLAEVERLTGS